ncbi:MULTISPECIES: helix-turn-helix transcriptional regulator [Halorussus]|uniref:ArsR/SmtB family transcription factor n=1 Tax=Halorussus TaxID=1070314 RepID=UPI000E210AB3|nr:MULTISPECIES: winged helix-turn-helix domain-containing protein [Halorussus]NHN61209.1 winged helix-turn-helix transcriptional regulator [Halorussus sp. JP-T4]
MSGQNRGGQVSDGNDGTAPACCSADHALSDAAVAADVETLATLGNDTRYEALRLIAGAEDGVCVCELEPSLGVSQSAVSQALSRLFSAGLVERRKEGRWRYYSATPRAERLLDMLDETRSVDDE